MTSEHTILNRLQALIEAGKRIDAARFASANFNRGARVQYGDFHGWRAQSRVALVSLLGENHGYLVDFDKSVTENASSHTRAGIAILAAVQADFQSGYFTTLRNLISAEVFTDFLDMAEYLLEQEYKDAAALLTGAVLEDGLKQIARSKNLQVKPRDDLTAVNSRCAEASVYSRLVQKQIQVWIDVRNKAAHGEFEEYTAQHVKDMHAGVVNFLSTYLGK